MLACHKNFEPKKCFFCDFLKKSSFLVIFDTVAHFLSKNVYFNICHSKTLKVTAVNKFQKFRVNTPLKRFMESSQASDYLEKLQLNASEIFPGKLQITLKLGSR